MEILMIFILQNILNLKLIQTMLELQKIAIIMFVLLSVGSKKMEEVLINGKIGLWLILCDDQTLLEWRK
jgi:hypothetical protein